MKSFILHFFWVIGVILFLDAMGTITTTGLYTKKDISLVIFICAALIIVSMIIKTVYTYKEKPDQRGGFFIKLGLIAALICANIIQFLMILSTEDMYLLFSK